MTGLGFAIYCMGIREKALRERGTDLADPEVFLAEAHRFGAGGIQAPIPPGDPERLRRLRSEAERLGMGVEAIVSPPRDRADLERFEAEVRAAREAGAGVARTVIIPERRYERFRSLDEFLRAAREGERSLELAEPVARRHGVRLAVENHKDQRIEERLDLLRRLGSDHVGACVDVGNSFALLEDPMEAVRAYAPWALSVHLKDQAVRECERGFLFADAALGRGFLDLEGMVRVLRAARPQARFFLETITRDALEVPVLAAEYYASFPEIPGADLARTLRTVREHAAPAPFPKVSDLPLGGQLALETENLERSVAYARDVLGL